MGEEKQKKLLETIKLISPGTPLREGLENILKGKMGGLIVIGDSEKVTNLVDGGFSLNVDFSSYYLYELSKMDGAIILSSDLKKILYANVQLIPDPSIGTTETGIRHRIADRVAKETGEAVISISQRRNIITLYRGYQKYIVQDTSRIFNKANQAIQTLEKYKTVLDQSMNHLSALEYEDLVTVYDVVTVLQRTEMVMRIAIEIERFIYELGNEGRLISMQLEELIANVEDDGKLILCDYKGNKELSIETIEKQIRSLSSEELLDLTAIAKIIGYDNNLVILDKVLDPKGYRILSKIPRIPLAIIENLIKEFKIFQNILKASIEKLDDVEGIGEIRARAIKEGLRRIQEQIMLGRHI